MLWGAIRDWADARALEAYFAELEKREPGWRDRVYGRELTAVQLDDHLKWNELQQAININTKAWGAYRQGLYQGMYQDATQPAAQIPAEQVEFLKAAHQYWQPVLQKLATIDKLPGIHRVIDRNASYTQMQNQIAGFYTSTAYVVNEGVELEVMYQIMMNDPAKAIQSLRNTRPPSLNHLYSMPFLVERLLNLTQPQSTELFQLQQFLEHKARIAQEMGFRELGTDLRLLEKSIRELGHGDLTNVEIDRMGYLLSLIKKDSVWNSSLLSSLRPFYLKSRVGYLFQRPEHLVLRLHQLADQVETLARKEPGEAWSTWKSFAEVQSIRIERKSSPVWAVLSTYPDAIPEGLFLLRARYLHMQMLLLFDQQAQLATALAAVVAERYRLDHGRFPADWSELVPRYIAKPIIDPYSGQPLKIKLNDKGIVIYSVGCFEKDEGGENLSNLHYWNYGGIGSNQSKTNLGTRVYLPTLRRGPAFPWDKEQQETLTEYTTELLKLMKEGKE